MRNDQNNEISIIPSGSTELDKSGNLKAITDKLLTESKFEFSGDFRGETIWVAERGNGWVSEIDNWVSEWIANNDYGFILNEFWDEIYEIDSNFILIFTENIDFSFRKQKGCISYSLLIIVDALTGDKINQIDLLSPIVRHTICSNKSKLYILLANDDILEVSLPGLSKNIVGKSLKSSLKITSMTLVENRNSIAISDVDGHLYLLNLETFIYDIILEGSIPIINSTYYCEEDIIFLILDDLAVLKVKIGCRPEEYVSIKFHTFENSIISLNSRNCMIASNSYPEYWSFFKKNPHFFSKTNIALNKSKKILAILFSEKIYILDILTLNIVNIYDAEECNAISFSDDGNYFAINRLNEVSVFDTKRFNKIVDYLKFSNFDGVGDWDDNWYYPNRVSKIQFSNDSRNIYGSSIFCLMKFK